MQIADACKTLDNHGNSTDAIDNGLPIIKELVEKYQANIKQTRTILKIGIVNALEIYTDGNNNPKEVKVLTKK